MVRQYKIHTNLDGSDNQIIDLTSGKIRLYQPSDLGIVTNTNIWSSQGLGVFGDTAVSHPSMDFKLETFGSSLQENYQIMNKFVSEILAQKYVTIEYTSEIGTFYADVKLAKVSKTEGYGQNGTFSETISFDVINKWYTYEQLTFSKFKNADFSDKTKIHAPFFKNQENLNLLDGTRDFKSYGVGDNTPNQNAGEIYFTQNKKVADLFKAGDYITISYDIEFLNTDLYSSSDGTFTQIQMYGGGWTWLSQVKAKNIDGKFYTRDTFKSSVYVENPTHKVTVSRTIQLTQDFITANATVNRVQLLYNYIPVGADTNLTNLKIEPAKDFNSTATPWMPSEKEAKEMEGYTYTDNAYVYTTEDNIERFSKWKIEENVFSFVARLTPSNSDVKKYGVRFLDEQANEYTSIIFNIANKPDYIQLNTDVNDEYYQTVTQGIAVNMFSALDFQKFRTRIFRKGTMELVNLDTVEMNVKRKVDFV